MAISRSSSFTSAAIPASTWCEASSMRIFTPKTWCTRSSRVCTLRGRNSACWLICSTTPSKVCLPDGIDGDFGFLADLDARNLGFRNVDAHVNLIALEQRGHRSIGRNQIAGTDIEHFDRRCGWARPPGVRENALRRRRKRLRRSQCLRGGCRAAYISSVACACR